MKRCQLFFFLLIFATCFSCAGPKLKETSAPLATSDSENFDPILFVENWIQENEKTSDIEKRSVQIESLLFDGKKYEAVVKITGAKEKVLLISFKKENARWVFLSKKSVAIDYAWPAR